ncbi:MAG: Na+/H+ antiporter NhaA [Planctomycetes bacterium]|nr:Na+/H+ antiporter NhaA [Planctomycetota bacterium]
MRKTIRFLLENSMFLIIGTVAALVWANVNKDSYEHFLHMELWGDTIVGAVHHDEAHEVPALEDEAKEVVEEPGSHAPKKKSITLHYLINDILMALFFAIAGKEVWEATFPGGPLSNPKKAATPLIATLGGMAGPALFYFIVAKMGGVWHTGDHATELSRGWAIPCATDIAFSYMVARMVFGAGHPAIPFLLLLAIADDALGLVILAAFYPNPDLPVEPMWLLLSAAGVVIGLVMRRMRLHSFWPYILVGGVCSWFGFALAGLHPALGLLPIIPTMPHAHVDTGLFDWSKMEKDDTLTHFEHSMKTPVELILGMFGLLNAGVAFSSAGWATSAVMIGLLVGKPVGIWVCGMFAARGLKFGFPQGMTSKDLFVLGCAGAIGFTVALFVASVAFKTGTPVQDAAKMGALGSFSAAIMTFIAGKVMGTQKVAGADKETDHH